MTSAMVSGIVQTLPSFSNAKPDSSSPENKGAGVLDTGTVSAKDSKPIPVDTISISDLSRQAVVDGKKEEAKKENTVTASNSGKSGTVTATVQFVYDLKGELIVRYMDTANRLVYQVPSRLVLRMRELATKSDLIAVDTKA